MKVDAGLVPDVEHLTSLRGVLAEHIGIQALKDMHVMLFLAEADPQMTEGVAAQVQGVEMPHGPLRLINPGVVGGSPMPMSVACIKVEFLQLRIIGQRVGQGVNCLGAKAPVEFLSQGKAARASQGGEVVFPRWAMWTSEGVLLQESSSGRKL